ncbi:MAG TPA: alpha/beta hydrolase [Acidimicrobiales bacterium]|nr:alpha/beta hydrolase [Acidimicrobiales bacterium]
MPGEASTVTLANGVTLSVAENGDRSRPALILLPGPTDSWWSYQPVLERIPTSIRTVAVSQRGHGDSDKPATGYGVEDFAADVPELLDALAIDRAVLAGHSGSCLVARRVAIDVPERVAGLVLEASPVTLRGNPVLEEFVESVVSRLEDPVDPEFARSFVVDTSSGDVQPEAVDRLVSELLKVPAHVWREMFADLLQYDDVDEIGRITAPALLLWGDTDTLVGREIQEQLAACLAHGRLLVYPGVGHTPRWEQPARFASDVFSFVERLGPDSTAGKEVWWPGTWS